MTRARRTSVATFGRYAAALAHEFRWTLAGLGAAVAAGTLLFALTPHASLGGARPTFVQSFFAAWMALFAETVFTPPETWYTAALMMVAPLVGFVVLGEGVVRLGLLMLSRVEGEKWWMKVMASTHRDHVVLCGLGHVGYRVLGQLLASGAEVVAIEKDGGGRFVAAAKETGAPVLVRDMKEDQALLDAGVAHARAIIVATNDDMANLEVALDARRMNPRIRVVMRMFDQGIAAKIGAAFDIDAAFSSSALAAPAVAAMSLEGRVLGTYDLGGVPQLAIELAVDAGSALVGTAIAALEEKHAARVVARRGGAGAFRSPPGDAPLAAGDVLVVHAPAARVAELRAGAKRPSI